MRRLRLEIILKKIFDLFSIFVLIVWFFFWSNLFWQFIFFYFSMNIINKIVTYILRNWCLEIIAIILIFFILLIYTIFILLLMYILVEFWPNFPHGPDVEIIYIKHIKDIRWYIDTRKPWEY